MKKEVLLIVLAMCMFFLTHAQERNFTTITPTNDALISYRMNRLDNIISSSALSNTQLSRSTRVRNTLSLAILGGYSKFIIQAIFVFIIAGATGALLGVKIASLITSIIDWDV